MLGADHLIAGLSGTMTGCTGAQLNSLVIYTTRNKGTSAVGYNQSSREGKDTS